MKKSKLIAIALTGIMAISLFGCDDKGGEDASSTCSHGKTISVMVDATCTEKGSTKRCCADCGYVYKEWETEALGHNYQIIKESSLAETCESGGYIVQTCLRCNYTMREERAPLGHTATENTAYDYLKSPKNASDKAEFYHSCGNCGKKMSTTFFVSVPKREEFVVNAPTITMYETKSKLSYGFTWNCTEKPLAPVVAIKEKSASSWEYHSVRVEDKSVIVKEGDSEKGSIYVCKAEIALDAGVEYEYKPVEMATEAEGAISAFTSVNPNASSFRFAAFSDTQNSSLSGNMWNSILKQTEDVDFYVHSGDIVQMGKYENYWKKMLNDNKQYLSVKPLMATSGNHETQGDYGGDDALLNHFHHNTPAQESKNKGYFYSYTYANAKFIMLNTNKLDYGNLPAEQYTWLINELENNDATWTIVVMHNPMYSTGAYGSDPSRNSIALSLRAQLGDIFAEYGVDVVLQGHDHNVFKTYPIGKNESINAATKQTVGGVEYDVNPQGTIYTMNGTAGAQTRAIVSSGAQNAYYEKISASQQSSWAEYTVTENTLTVSVKNLSSGSVQEYYSWGILKQ